MEKVINTPRQDEKNKQRTPPSVSTWKIESEKSAVCVEGKSILKSKRETVYPSMKAVKLLINCAVPLNLGTPWRSLRARSKATLLDSIERRGIALIASFVEEIMKRLFVEKEKFFPIDRIVNKAIINPASIDLRTGGRRITNCACLSSWVQKQIMLLNNYFARLIFYFSSRHTSSRRTAPRHPREGNWNIFQSIIYRLFKWAARKNDDRDKLMWEALVFVHEIRWGRLLCDEMMALSLAI